MYVQLIYRVPIIAYVDPKLRAMQETKDMADRTGNFTNVVMGTSTIPSHTEASITLYPSLGHRPRPPRELSGAALLCQRGRERTDVLGGDSDEFRGL